MVSNIENYFQLAPTLDGHYPVCMYYVILYQFIKHVR